MIKLILVGMFALYYVWKFILPTIPISTLNTVKAVLIGIAALLVILIVVRLIFKLFQACFGRKKELAQLENNYDILRQNIDVFCQPPYSFTCNTSLHKVKGKRSSSWQKDIMISINTKSKVSAEIAKRLGMDVDDYSISNKKPIYHLYFILESKMMFFERLILLYRFYDRIEDRYYQEDDIDFYLLKGKIEGIIKFNSKSYS